MQEEKKKALPPGTSDFLGEKAEIQQGNLRVLYVGGIGAHYQLHTLFDVVRNNKFVTLFVCVPEQQWADLEHEYSGLLAENIKVVHYYGPALEKLFLKTDLCSLFVAPSDYRAFAAPVKLYDYIGHHKPVIATKGTLAGDFVSTNGCGWTIEYDQEQLADLLTYLSQNPEEVETYQSNVADLAVLHTWKARAQQVVQDAERISVRYSSSRTVRK
ncbi:MAG: hypothetical protein CSA82_01870 [Actinobacteria bacterium]|nr:MAG: hypothetical protein CSA82_01870 [Actinomycetota bacterium]